MSSRYTGTYSPARNTNTKNNWDKLNKLSDKLNIINVGY